MVVFHVAVVVDVQVVGVIDVHTRGMILSWDTGALETKIKMVLFNLCFIDTKAHEVVVVDPKDQQEVIDLVVIVDPKHQQETIDLVAVVFHVAVVVDEHVAGVVDVHTHGTIPSLAPGALGALEPKNLDQTLETKLLL